MILSILFWILGISIGLLGLVAIAIMKILWLALPWIIFVVFVAAVIVSGLRDLSNKNKAP